MDEDIPPFLRRIHQLGHIDIFTKDPKLRFNKIIGRWIKISSALLTDKAETVFDDTLNCLAELTLMEAELPGTFPGIEAMRPFLRSHRVGKLSGLTPWPATRHLYVAEDFEDLRETMSNQPIPVTSEKNHNFLDYLRLGEASADIRVKFDLKTLWDRLYGDDTEKQSSGFIDLQLSDLGTRMVTSEGEIRLLQVLIPADETTDTLLTRLARHMGVPKNSSPYKVAHFTTLTKNSLGRDEVKTSFMLVDSDELLDASIGWSPNPKGHRLFTEDQASFGAWANSDLFRPLGVRALLQMGLPAYFNCQLDAIEDNVFDGAGRRMTEESPNEAQASRHKKRRAYKPKMFRIVRALRTPVREHITSGVNAKTNGASKSPRKEPETQVAIKGFWRRIGESSIGKGPDGQPEIGRTWIAPFMRWKDKPPAQKLPYAKEPLMPHLTDPRRS